VIVYQSETLGLVVVDRNTGGWVGWWVKVGIVCVGGKVGGWAA
jgi:hypothetical protein